MTDMTNKEITDEEEPEEKDLKDLCLNCGALIKRHLWGGSCSCKNPNVVHQSSCDGCGRLIGVMVDDDYCCPTKLFCPDCMNKARKA